MTLQDLLNAGYQQAPDGRLFLPFSATSVGQQTDIAPYLYGQEDGRTLGPSTMGYRIKDYTNPNDPDAYKTFTDPNEAYNFYTQNLQNTPDVGLANPYAGTNNPSYFGYNFGGDVQSSLGNL